MFPIYFEKEDIRRIAITFSIILILAGLIALAVWGKRGFPVTTHRVDYQMQGFYVDEDGNVGEKTDFTVKGRVFDNSEKHTFLELDFAMPTSFPYSLKGATCHPWGYEDCFSDQGYGFFSYWVVTGYTYNRQSGVDHATFMHFALCPEQEYFLFRASDVPDKYFVASTDPNTTAQEILDYFDSFIGTLQ